MVRMNSGLSKRYKPRTPDTSPTKSCRSLSLAPVKQSSTPESLWERLLEDTRAYSDNQRPSPQEVMTYMQTSLFRERYDPYLNELNVAYSTKGLISLRNKLSGMIPARDVKRALEHMIINPEV